MAETGGTMRIDASWMRDTATCAVMDALDSDEPEASRFVGGCVRNTLMRRPVDDIDIATRLTPDQVIAALERAGLRAVPTGVEHGTVTAISGSQPFEITTLRRDVETDGRRAVVAFSTDWAEDASRRDFRLNALYADRDGAVHDLIGGGVDDALSGRVIFIGDADERLREDYLRILRFFRFNAWYGQAIDPEGLAACARQARGLETIAAERIWKEMHKLLAAPDPSVAVAAMAQHGLVRASLGIEGRAKRLSRLVRIESAAGLSPDPLRRFLALLPGTPDLEDLQARLRLSRAETRRLEAALEAAADTGRLPGRLYRHGPEAVRDAICLKAVDLDRRPSGETLARIEAWRRPAFPLNGRDALSLGLTGKSVGQALDQLESDWIDSDFRLSRDTLLQRLAALKVS